MTRKLFQDTQFIGFEMSHTGARTKYEQQKSIVEGDPTCVGVCYTLKQSTELGGFSYYQDTRLHRLKDVGDKFVKCISEYKNAAGKLPKTIVIYRVGYGEGYYEKVRQEVDDMKVAAQKYEEG